MIEKVKYLVSVVLFGGQHLILQHSFWLSILCSIIVLIVLKSWREWMTAIKTFIGKGKPRVS